VTGAEIHLLEKKRFINLKSNLSVISLSNCRRVSGCGKINDKNPLRMKLIRKVTKSLKVSEKVN